MELSLICLISSCKTRRPVCLRVLATRRLRNEWLLRKYTKRRIYRATIVQMTKARRSVRSHKAELVPPSRMLPQLSKLPASHPTSHTAFRTWKRVLRKAADSTTAVIYNSRTVNSLHTSSNNSNNNTRMANRVTTVTSIRCRIGPLRAMQARVSNRHVHVVRMRRMLRQGYCLSGSRVIARIVEQLLCHRCNWSKTKRIRASLPTHTNMVKSRLVVTARAHRIYRPAMQSRLTQPPTPMDRSTTQIRENLPTRLTKIDAKACSK